MAVTFHHNVYFGVSLSLLDYITWRKFECGCNLKLFCVQMTFSPEHVIKI